MFTQIQVTLWDTFIIENVCSVLLLMYYTNVMRKRERVLEIIGLLLYVLNTLCCIQVIHFKSIIIMHLSYTLTNVIHVVTTVVYFLVVFICSNFDKICFESNRFLLFVTYQLSNKLNFIQLFESVCRFYMFWNWFFLFLKN